VFLQHRYRLIVEANGAGFIEVRDLLTWSAQIKLIDFADRGCYFLARNVQV